MALKRDTTDKWFSDCIRLRANWTCEHCGAEFHGPDKAIQCAHIISRKHNVLRWCADNAVSLCGSCHATFTDSPPEFTHWLESHLGEGHLEILKDKKRGILKLNKGVRKEISDHYRLEFKRMESEGTNDLISWN